MFNEATHHDICSLLVKLAPRVSKQKDTQEGRLFSWLSHRRQQAVRGSLAGGLSWLPAGCPQEPNKTATSCHFNSQSERVTHQTNDFSKATSFPPNSMGKAVSPHQINAALSTQALAICDQRHTQAHSLTYVAVSPGVHINVVWYTKHLISKSNILPPQFYMDNEVQWVLHYHWTKCKCDNTTSHTHHMFKLQTFMPIFKQSDVHAWCWDPPESHTTNWLLETEGSAVKKMHPLKDKEKSGRL